MITEATILHRDIEGKFQELVPLVEKLKDYVAHNAVNTKELADVAFAAREAEKSIEEFQKRLRELKRVASTACCITLAMTGENIVRTNHCTASPNPKPWFKLPYKRLQNPEKWDTIMDGIGVSQVANEKDLVRIYAPSFMDYCAELMAEGFQPPAGIDPKECTSMELNLRITKKK